MLDATTAQLIDEVVGLWISQGRAFTTYEVSKEVQARLNEKKLPFVRHLDLQEYYPSCRPLQDEIDFGSYNRTLIDVGAADKANLFHPDTYDPATYKPMSRNGNVGVLPPVVGAGGAVATGAQLPNMIYTNPQPSSNGSAFNGSTKIHKVNQSDELWIGSQYLAKIGLGPGNPFQIFQEGKGVAIASTAPSGANVLKSLFVEQKGNSRLSAFMRKNFGFTGTSFDFEVKNDRILITEV